MFRWIRIFFVTSGLVLGAIRDLMILFLPGFLARLMVDGGSYGFMIHPQSLADVQLKFPFAKHLPPALVEKCLMFIPPLIGSRIKGLKDVQTGKEVSGYVVICPLSAKQMHADRNLAKRKILQAVRFAEKLGVKMIGLGALTASMTEGGGFLTDKVNTGITTGHAFTTAIIIEMLLEVSGMLEKDVSTLTVAVVGAAGYMGTPVTRLVAKKDPKRLILIDRQRKKEALEKLAKEISEPRKEVVERRKVIVSVNLSKLIEADIVIVVTNSLEVIIKPEHLKAGAVVLDDTAPRNTSMELVTQRPDVMILDVVAQAPHISSHFNFRFPLKSDIYTCMGEALILAARGWKQNYALGHFDYGLVDEILKWGKEMGFGVAPFRTFNQLVTLDKITRIKSFYQSQPAEAAVPRLTERKT